MTIDSKSINGYAVAVTYDDSPESPRDWDNASHILMKQRGYDLPWECDEDFDADTYGIVEMTKALQRRHDAAFVFPIYCYEHGLVSYTAGRAVADEWDSGLAGVAYVTNEAISEARNYYCGTPEFDAEVWAKSIVDGELDTYTQWSNGSVYGYTVKDPLGNVVDSCWGYYDSDEAMAEGVAFAEAQSPVKAIIVPDLAEVSS